MSGGLGPLRRAADHEVPPKEHWNLRAAFEIEKARVEQWLYQAARQNLSPENSSVESALAAGRSLPEELTGYLALEQAENRDPTVTTRAENGDLQKGSPTRGWLRTLLVLTWLFMLAEVGLFAVQWLVGVSSPIVIIHGLVLSFSAFLVGWGIGMLGVEAELGGGSRNPRTWAAIVGGVLGVAGIALLRASGGGEGIWVVITFTLVLALLIILFEALRVFGKATYRENRRQMFMAQQWVAKEQHRRDSASGLWGKTYERFVRELAQTRDRPRPLRPETAPSAGPPASGDSSRRGQTV